MWWIPDETRQHNGIQMDEGGGGRVSEILGGDIMAWAEVFEPLLVAVICSYLRR